MNPNDLVILASESPRRKMLLEEAGFSIVIFPVKVSEILEKNLNVHEQILNISRHKWRAAQREWSKSSTENHLLLTADTMVVFQNQALGKPANFDDAVRTLEQLSGQSHQVITAVTLGRVLDQSPLEDFSVTTVRFRLISRQEIEAYVQNGEPLDKAGSYGIQGLGGKFVEKIEGPFDNVVGLPIELVRNLIEKRLEKDR